MKAATCFLIVPLLAVAFPLFAADEPWEAADCADPRTAFNASPRLSSSLARAAIDRALDAYQSTQSEKSIHRCVFFVSCSFFLVRAVDVYGVPLGVIAFADRYLFRENPIAYLNYKFRKRADGVYKLDDGYFLEP